MFGIVCLLRLIFACWVVLPVQLKMLLIYLSFIVFLTIAIQSLFAVDVFYIKWWWWWWWWWWKSGYLIPIPQKLIRWPITDQWPIVFFAFCSLFLTVYSDYLDRHRRPALMGLIIPLAACHCILLFSILPYYIISWQINSLCVSPRRADPAVQLPM